MDTPFRLSYYDDRPAIFSCQSLTRRGVRIRKHANPPALKVGGRFKNGNHFLGRILWHLGFVGADSRDYALQACITNGFQEGKSARIFHKRHQGERVPCASIAAETSGNGRASSG